MSENLDLNIIIPAYNAKETLDKTLMSLCLQRTKYKFDVLVVNDKSDYNYKNIINKYNNYLNIKELELKENVGPGLARQKGIEQTKSKYIMFIDADDYLYTPYSIEVLLNGIEKSNSDIVVSKFIIERDNKREILDKDLIWLHGKVYRRNFLEENNISFNNTRKNEDNGFNRLLYLLGEKVEYINDITYVYQENPNSITRKDNRIYKLEGLEGLATNMEWAYFEAKKRNAKEIYLKMHLLSTLTGVYYLYNELYEKYDVSKILKWFKNIYLELKNYKIEKEDIDLYLNINKDNLETIEKPIISYEEFLNKLEEYHD